MQSPSPKEVDGFKCCIEDCPSYTIMAEELANAATEVGKIKKFQHSTYYDNLVVLLTFFGLLKRFHQKLKNNTSIHPIQISILHMTLDQITKNLNALDWCKDMHARDPLRTDEVDCEIGLKDVSASILEWLRTSKFIKK